MSLLRNSKPLARLAALLLLLGMLAQGFAPHAAMLPGDGICHADTTPDAPSAPATQDHDACCLLGKLPLAGLLPAPLAIPRPATIAAAPQATAPAAFRQTAATAAYRSRAPPPIA